MACEHISYGELAVKYANCLIETGETPSSKGWIKFAQENEFTQSGAKKGCTKNTFLSLCSEGLIKGISQGVYTNARENYQYAVEAVKILRENSELSSRPKELWRKIPDAPDSYNQQMHVVCALWNDGLIIEKP